MKCRKNMDKTILSADNVLRQMKPNTNSRKVFDRRRAVEALEKFWDFRFFDADTGISDCYFGIVFQGKKVLWKYVRFHSCILQHYPGYYTALLRSIWDHDTP